MKKNYNLHYIKNNIVKIKKKIVHGKIIELTKNFSKIICCFLRCFLFHFHHLFLSTSIGVGKSQIIYVIHLLKIILLKLKKKLFTKNYRVNR